jgi:hypothetical protein
VTISRIAARTTISVLSYASLRVNRRQQAKPAFGGRRMAYRLRENRMMGFGQRIALEFRGR